MSAPAPSRCARRCRTRCSGYPGWRRAWHDGSLPGLGYDARPHREAGPMSNAPDKPTKDQAEAAVRTLLAWAGEDPTREGLLDTPKRVVEAYGDWYSGYNEDPREFLARTFKEVAGYD